jgi:hypothetical protein
MRSYCLYLVVIVGIAAHGAKLEAQANIRQNHSNGWALVAYLLCLVLLIAYFAKRAKGSLS